MSVCACSGGLMSSLALVHVRLAVSANLPRPCAIHSCDSQHFLSLII